MKIILLSVCVCLYSTNATAQNNYRVTYKGTVRNYTLKCTSIFNDSLLISYLYNTKNDPYYNTEVLGYKSVYHASIFSKNYNCLFFFSPRGKKYLLFDSIPYKNWVVGSQTKTIAGYECQSAYAVKGKADTAFIFFAKEIKLSYGPYKIIGAPGLIMEAYDNSTDFYWIADTVEHTTTAIIFPQKVKFIPMKDF